MDGMENSNKLEEHYDLPSDWKFISIVQFVNVFKNVNSIDPITSLELEHSLKYPEIEPVCFNILLKLLMKKALFKPNSKIGENFEFSKLHEMLLKKINYFYKTYLRYLKKLNGVTDNSSILDLIKKDIEEYNETKLEKYKLTTTNLAEKQYEELDLKNLMVVEFFRSLNGRNPFLKSTMQDDNMEKYMNQEEKEEKNADNLMDNTKNKNITTDLEHIEDYLSFNELSLRDKVEVLFFFCNYALTFSGRSSFFKEELLKDSKDPLNNHIAHKRIKAIGFDSYSNPYYSILCNKDCRIFKEKEDKTFELIVRNYAELEQFINILEMKSSNNQNLPETNLLKNIRENLLSFKENDDEEQKRELAFIRKQQAFEKAKKLGNKSSGEVEKYHNSDYFLMNLSDHVITRNQLNQITKINVTQINLNNPQSNKTQVVTEDEKKKIKIEKEKLERQKRMEKRNKLIIKRLNEEGALDEASSSINNMNNLNRKRGRGNRMSRSKNKVKLRKRGNRKFESSEDEYESSAIYSDVSNEQNLKISMELESEREEENDGEYINENLNINEEDSSSDIVIDGNLVYRYSSNQIELEGMWYMNSDPTIKERVSYLFLKSNEFYECYINKEDITADVKNNNSNNMASQTSCLRDFKIKICAANFIECILLNKMEIFDSLLNFLSGEYSGFFMYYGKTIEDRVNLNLSLQDSLVRISGEGTNNLGNFSILGYLNFFRTKQSLLDKNELDSDIIKIADFKFTKIYRNFNPNENYRVIKSYQHRRKKNDDDNFNF